MKNQVVHPTHYFSEVINICGNEYTIHSLKKAEQFFQADFSFLPYSVRLVIESQLRAYANGHLSTNQLDDVMESVKSHRESVSIPYYPSRVVIQDYTGVPLLTDLAALREAIKEDGGHPQLVNPVVQTDIVVDHSIQVDSSRSFESLTINMNREYERNKERYQFLKWGEQTFENVRIFPPGSGIIHQINLEFLASLIKINDKEKGKEIIPDSVIGTDSHTTMINALGILGWGVGGIEAESVMLGYPVTLPIPSVVGVELEGELRPGVTTTDLVLTLTELLRNEGVVNQFVEFFGNGVQSLKLPERATIANMAPEFGATCAYFPIDDETFSYLRETGRDEALIEIAKEYYDYQGLVYREEGVVPTYQKKITVKLSEVVPSVAGPKRPQDRVGIHQLKSSFEHHVKETYGVTTERLENSDVDSITHGSLLIAAITSCTNTSNPSVIIAAGLLARNAYNKGLSVPSYVKTSFSPGSKVVSDYLNAAGLTFYLDQLGFQNTGYGCMTCSGSSGPLEESIEERVERDELIAASVLSGNRNFEGRIHPLIKANYLASPPLVIAYALTGRMNVDLESEPIGLTPDGEPVFMKDVWPSHLEVKQIMDEVIGSQLYQKAYKNEALIDKRWSEISQETSLLYPWDAQSTYIRKPTYLEQTSESTHSTINGARVLALLGDSITTDHISPGGKIGNDNPAGIYLASLGVSPRDFDTFGARRGNHEVMKRGTFSNVRLRNELVPGREGGVTTHVPSGDVMSIYEAAMRYEQDQTPLLIIAGKEYGSGSSRDWAAKGTALLGVRAVLAESFERIHRSNLINMGVLPLQFKDNENRSTLGLTGKEVYHFTIPAHLDKQSIISVEAIGENERVTSFDVVVRIDTEDELEFYQSGGILQHVFTSLLTANAHTVGGSHEGKKS
ncbi:aconitate hydratase AcnA [Metabacillus iocasae]|uniref:Aconitate hydratase n=1 Tax=Priestia iocasae TaxID=2291674 RepID=A0ABS2QS38_9BACI|nr:aconitate hydratase [Metabacillus iocasae]